MLQDAQNTTLYLSLGEDATSSEVNALTTQLLNELASSQADTVEKLRDDALTDGAKGDPITVGAIALGVTVAAAPEIVKLISGWINRRSAHTISLKIKLGDDEIEFTTAATSSPTEIEKLADRFAMLLKKHRANRTGE